MYLGDLTELKLTVMYVSEMAAILRWDNFITHDQRDILGWVLYTRAALVTVCPIIFSKQILNIECCFEVFLMFHLTISIQVKVLSL